MWYLGNNKFSFFLNKNVSTQSTKKFALSGAIHPSGKV